MAIKSVASKLTAPATASGTVHETFCTAKTRHPGGCLCLVVAVLVFFSGCVVAKMVAAKPMVMKNSPIL